MAQPAVSSRSRSISLNAAFTAFVQVASKGIAFLVAIAIARIYGPDEYGAFAIALTLTTVMMAFAEFGLEQQFVRTVSVEPASLAQTLGAFFTALLPVTLVLVLAMPVAARLLGYSPLVLELVTVLAVYWFFLRFHYPFITLMRVRFRAEVTAVVQSVSILAQVAAITLVVLQGWSITAVAISQALVAFLTLVIWLLVTRPLLRQLRLHWPAVKGIFRGAMEFAPQTVSWVIYFHVGALILSFYESEGEVGLFTAIFRLLFILYIVPEAFMTSCAPVLYRCFGGNRPRFDQLARFSNRLMLMVALVVTFLLGIGAEPIIGLIYGAEFLPGLPLLYWLVPGVLCRVASLGMLEVLTTSNNQRYRNRVLQGGLLLNIGLNVWLVPLHGALGAAIAASATELVMLLAVVASCIRLRLPLLRWRQDLVPATALLLLMAGSHWLWSQAGGPAWVELLATAAVTGTLLSVLLWRDRGLLRETVPHH
jgi:O-antigen/teichoic acid export membrane protein